MSPHELEEDPLPAPAHAEGPEDRSMPHHESLGPDRGRRIARIAVVGLGSIGTSISLYLTHCTLVGNILTGVEAMATVLLVTLLFASETYSERAFRLLRWIRDKPEPPCPPRSAPPAL